MIEFFLNSNYPSLQINKDSELSLNDFKIPEESDSECDKSEAASSSSWTTAKSGLDFKELYASSRSKRSGSFQPTFKASAYVRSESATEQKKLVERATSHRRSASDSFEDRPVDMDVGDKIELCPNEARELEEPILKLNLGHELLGSLIQLFGEEADEAYLESKLVWRVLFMLLGFEGLGWFYVVYHGPRCILRAVFC